MDGDEEGGGRGERGNVATNKAVKKSYEIKMYFL